MMKNTATRNALQHTATHCNTLQHTETHCNILQHAFKTQRGRYMRYDDKHCNKCNTLQHWNTLQHTATRFRDTEREIHAVWWQTLQHTATHCNTLKYTATYCNTLQHTATHWNTLQHTATRFRDTEREKYYIVAKTHRMPHLYRSLPPKRPTVSGSLAKNDLLLKASYGSWPKWKMPLLPRILLRCRIVVRWIRLRKPKRGPWRARQSCWWRRKRRRIADVWRQSVAVCCSVLQCVAVCCSVLQCVAVCCSVLQCVAVCYSVV